MQERNTAQAVADLCGVEVLVVRPDAGDATGLLFSGGDFQHGDFAGAF